MTPGQREWILGSNTLRYEPPDLFWMKFRGPLTLQDAMRILGIYQEMQQARPFIFVAEMQEAGRLDPEVGRYLSENLPSEWMLGSIYIGARLLHRAMAKGLALASRLSSQKDENALEKIHHVSTMTQAQALITQLRAQSAREGT